MRCVKTLETKSQEYKDLILLYSENGVSYYVDDDFIQSIKGWTAERVKKIVNTQDLAKFYTQNLNSNKKAIAAWLYSLENHPDIENKTSLKDCLDTLVTQEDIGREFTTAIPHTNTESLPIESIDSYFSEVDEVTEDKSPYIKAEPVNEPSEMFEPVKENLTEDNMFEGLSPVKEDTELSAVNETQSSYTHKTTEYNYSDFLKPENDEYLDSVTDETTNVEVTNEPLFETEEIFQSNLSEAEIEVEDTEEPNFTEEIKSVEEPETDNVLINSDSEIPAEIYQCLAILCSKFNFVLKQNESSYVIEIMK